jgi:hypothetical protein
MPKEILKDTQRCLFSRATVTHFLKLSGLYNRNFFLIFLWKLEVRDQGVSKVSSSWGLSGRICSMPLGYPWVLKASPQSLSTFSHDVLTM